MTLAAPGTARALVAVVALAAACSDRQGPSAPSTPSTPTTPTAAPPPPPSEWVVNGRVFGTVGGEPIAGAAVTVNDGATTFNETTDANGRFTLRRATAPASRLATTVVAPGYISRTTNIAVSRTAEATIDLIRQAAPFDLKYYQALARNGDEGFLYSLSVWNTDANFYVNTIDDGGRTIEPEVLTFLQDQLPKAFRAWTDNTRNAIVTSGTGPAPPNAPSAPSRVVNIRLVRGRDDGVCGSASIGGTFVEFNVDYCACGSKKIASATIWHEVGHIAGFFHVRSYDAVMYPYVGPVCAVYDRLTSLEQVHAGIAYRRPRGNQDPDRDPSLFELLRPLPVATPWIIN